jgi:ATP-dependent RNA helicase RhlE
MSEFQNLGLHERLLTAVRDQGYKTPTTIQARAIPVVLAGDDVLACAQTGTGKTAAFALPSLDHLMRGPRCGRDPRVLVLVPTRELAAQVGESFSAYARGTGLRTAVVFGGVPQSSQVRALRAGVDVVVAAPGRLLDLLDQRLVSLGRIELVVLDEADRMLDMGFIHPIRKLLSAVPKQRQTLMFSATMPTGIRELATQLLRNPRQIAVTPVASTVGTIAQDVYYVERGAKTDLLVQVLAAPNTDRVLVFTRTKHGADRLALKLRRARIGTEVIHGNKAQGARQRALANFRSGTSRVLVATDVAARGIDVDHVSHVVNYDVPEEPESYVHRIGRTGRAGAAGVAISFCDHEERRHLHDIERLIKHKLRVVTHHSIGGGHAHKRRDEGPIRDRRDGIRRGLSESA